jgi:hypothetical protein
MKQRKRIVLALVAAGSIGVASLAVAVTRMATRPLDVAVVTQIDIFAKQGNSWKQVDSVGPQRLNFKASLLELAGSGEESKVQTAFHWNTRSKKGKPYSVKLAGDARTKFRPTSGRLDAELSYEISYDGMTAIVPATLTTDQLSSPKGGALRGSSARGLFGRAKSDFTLVSKNSFKPAGGPEYLFLCHEQYTMTPAGR